MKLLLHTCCAPCSVKCIETFQSEGIEPDLFWYNPNIHPFMEYENRKQALKKYTNLIDIKLIMYDVYGLRDFISKIYPNFENRCEKCYKIRIEETARYAAEHAYDCFSTTLLISPYQNRGLICEIANEAARKYNVAFLYRDFRAMFRGGQKIARENNLYMQKYCGCIFSEEERYAKKQTQNYSGYFAHWISIS